MSVLVTCEIFRLFLNTLTPDDNYSRRYNNVKRFYLKKKSHFVDFLLRFRNLHEI